MWVVVHLAVAITAILASAYAIGLESVIYTAIAVIGGAYLGMMILFLIETNNDRE
jgi:hypothetical protein